MKLSVFGGTGFVGSAFVKYALTEPGYIMVRERENYKPFTDTDSLWFISTTHNYNVWDKPTLDVETNLLLLCKALEEFKNTTPFGVFNFISSWFVYGDNGISRKNREDDPCNPKGFYSITKHCAEQLVQSYCKTHGLNYRILRLCNVVGLGDKPTKQKNALQYLINEMKLGKDIQLYNAGRFYRNYMHVDDVAHAIHMIIRQPAWKKNINQIFNIGHSEHLHFAALIDYAAEKIGYKGKIKRMTPTTFHGQIQIASFTMNTNKLQSYGFKPKYDLQEMVDTLL